MLIEQLGRVDYEPTFEAMRAYTESRQSQSADRLWLCEHPPVFTQGLAGQAQLPSNERSNARNCTTASAGRPTKAQSHS